MLMGIIILLVVLILAGLIYLATLDGNYVIRRQLLINANIETVFNTLRDFKSWPEWSPWLMHEPDTKLVYSDKPDAEGSYYHWDGKYVGAGKLTHIKLQRPDLIAEKIEFIRPFKSVCDVSFELEDQQGKTNVSWIMHGKMPFLFRFMVPRTVEMISKDYDLGLAMLSGKLNPAAEHPRISFVGETTREAQHCLCKGFAGHLTEMETAMQTGFPELMKYIQGQDTQPSNMPLSVYHKVNLKKMHFVCDMAIPVAEDIDSGSYETKQLGGGRYFKVTLQGSYRFLELAWYSAYAHLYMLKIKLDKKRPALEVYENDPNQIENTNEIMTSIYVPVK